MATGWWAEVFFAKIAAQAQRAVAVLTGEQPESGSIAAAAQRATAALVGEQPESGSIAAQTQRAATALVGVMQPAGILAAQAQLAAAALSGGQTQQGAIAAIATRATAAMSGSQAVPLAIVGTVNTSQAGTVIIPPHAVGQMICIFAFNAGATAPPSKPAPAGSVPNYVDVPNCANTGANSCASRTVQFVATANNHTSGTWSNVNNMIAFVVSGQAASPIGGSAESGGTSTADATAPSVTQANATGTSMLVHLLGRRGNVSNTMWSAAPAGYTSKASDQAKVRMLTKDVTTSDGSVTNATDGSSSTGYRGATVEILAA